ncbi:ribonuclease III [Teratosphaeria destructans]|uniref:Ribonuclease III n=1 Tax=Teratosphaeria destructans TaxID=418781 RepID=A0A9W7T0S3_9PEZI|nr:ribonuclease III [Teratosphaeria destructans]
MCTLITLSSSSRLTDKTSAYPYDTLGNYIFQKPHLLIEALYPYHGKPIRIGAKIAREGNQSLAWLGDSVLAVALKMPWYAGRQTRKYSTNHWFQRMTSNKHLAKLAVKHGIHRFCFPSGATMGYKALATTMEALIGAVYLDSGYDLGKVQVVMEAMGLGCPADARGPEIPVYGLTDLHDAGVDPQVSQSKSTSTATRSASEMRLLKATRQLRSSRSSPRRNRPSNQSKIRSMKRLRSIRKMTGYLRSAQVSSLKARMYRHALLKAVLLERAGSKLKG